MSGADADYTSKMAEGNKTFPKCLASEAAGGRGLGRRLKRAEWDGGPVQITITVGMRQADGGVDVRCWFLSQKVSQAAPPAPKSRVAGISAAAAHHAAPQGSTLNSQEEGAARCTGVTGDEFSLIASALTVYPGSFGNIARLLRRPVLAYPVIPARCPSIRTA